MAPRRAAQAGGKEGVAFCEMSALRQIARGAALFEKCGLGGRAGGGDGDAARLAGAADPPTAVARRRRSASVPSPAATTAVRTESLSCTT